MNGTSEHAPGGIEAEDHRHQQRSAAVHAGAHGDPQHLARDQLLGVHRRGQDRRRRCAGTSTSRTCRTWPGTPTRTAPRWPPCRCPRTPRSEAADLRDQRAEAEAEGQQVDRGLDRGREDGGAPVGREVDHLAHQHPAAGRGARCASGAGAAGARGDARRRSSAISSPVSSTNTSSRLAVRRSPSGARPRSARSSASTATEVPVRRVDSPRAVRRALGLGQLVRRPVDLHGLAAGVLGDQVGRRPGGHGPAVRT